MLEAATRGAAERLTELSDNEVLAKDVRAGLELLDLALMLDPRSVRAHALAAGVQFTLALKRDPLGSYDATVRHADQALAKNALYPLEPKETMVVRARLGSALLFVGGRDPEAFEHLLAVVKDPGMSAAPSAWGDRYNLACAAARLGKKDVAFEQLALVIEHHAQEPVWGIEHWREDGDLAGLRDDPRWKALLDKHPPPSTEPR